MGNQNPQIEEGQTIQWSKEKGQTTIYKALQIKLASLAFLLEATLYQGTRSFGILDQLRGIYSICKRCLNVATYNGKFTMGKLKSSLLS